MYRITYVLGPEEGLLRQSINTLLATMTMLCADEMRAHPELPPLYTSGIQYLEEPCGEDNWQDALTTWALKSGDCEDLAVYRAAELQVRHGVMAWPTPKVTRSADGKLSFHTRVRLPNGLIEDPARMLGLTDPDHSHSCTGLGGGQRENRITFELDLFQGTKELGLSKQVLRLLLNALYIINIRYLLAHPETPRLYRSGVVYNEEPEGREDWQDIPTTLARREGDCEDLATHRAAEVFVFGDEYGRRYSTWPIFTAKPRPNGSYLYHILVAYPDGRVEDPSRVLGM